MSRHNYPFSALLADYLRAALGCAIVGTPLVLADALPVLSYILAALTALFLVFGIRTALRHGTVVELDDDGVRVRGPLRKEIAWTALRQVELRYYSTRRDRQSGWMQLAIAGERETIRLDSNIDGFTQIVDQAVRRARQRALSFSPTTLENLKSMGMSEAAGPEDGPA